MANRAAHEERWSLDAACWSVFATIKWVAGVPVLQKFTPPSSVPGSGRQGAYSAAPVSNLSGMPTGTAGVATIARQSAGDFLLTLQDRYNRLLGVYPTWLNATGLPTIDKIGVKSGSSAFLGGNQIEFLTIKKTGTGTGSFTGSAANVAPNAAALVAALAGATVSWASNVGTVSAGGATIASGALRGGWISDGTTWAEIIDNSAITATTGTITVAPVGPIPSGVTVSAYAINGRVTATGTVGGTFTLADAAADPVDGDILELELVFSNSTVPQ